MSRRRINRILNNFDCGVSGSVPAAVTIYPGDLIWQHTDGWRPASDTNLWTVSEANTVAALKDKFVGIAVTGKDQVTHAEDILVSRDCIAKMPCTSATYAFGVGVSGKKDTGGNYLYAQEVQTDTDAADQVGRVSKAEASAVTEVEVHFRSSYLPDYIT